MEMMTEVIGGPIPPLQDLVASLEQATLMAKQLPTITDPTQILQIYSSLNTAHHHLSSFLSYHHHPPAEISVSSAVSPSTTANNMEAEPMQVGDNGEEEEEEAENSKNTIDMVEEQMRDCFIKSKRLKRAISPSLAAATERGRSSEDGIVRCEVGFDPNSTRLRALDLIYQFHG